VAGSPLSSLPTSSENSARIEACLLETVRIDGDDYLTEIASHLIKAGGKRQRPHLTAAAAATGLADGTPVSDDVIRGGVAVELVQVGSLYHDDVMDEAEIRRQVDSVNARWGNHRAILAGDYLLAQAAVIAASLGVEVAGLLGSTIAELCKGQVAELQSLNDLDRTVEAYLPSIAGKTASLFAASTRIGGLVGGFDAATVDRLTEYGWLYGMAFQVVDDILDVIATDEQLGKPAGNDMLEGVYSLPVIHTLAGPTGSELADLLTGGLSLEDRHQAIACVRNGPGVDTAYDVAADYVTQARSAIVDVADNQAATAMADMAQHLLQSVTSIREGTS
jgi:heptaprenyl diphosphate synthase